MYTTLISSDVIVSNFLKINKYMYSKKKNKKFNEWYSIEIFYILLID